MNGSKNWVDDVVTGFYSGPEGNNFWERVNDLMLRGKELNALGVALQTLELVVLNNLAQAEAAEDEAIEESYRRRAPAMAEAAGAVGWILSDLIGHNISCWRNGNVTTSMCEGYDAGMILLDDAWHNVSSFDKIELQG